QESTTMQPHTIITQPTNAPNITRSQNTTCIPCTLPCAFEWKVRTEPLENNAWDLWIEQAPGTEPYYWNGHVTLENHSIPIPWNGPEHHMLTLPPSTTHADVRITLESETCPATTTHLYLPTPPHTLPRTHAPERIHTQVLTWTKNTTAKAPIEARILLLSDNEHTFRITSQITNDAGTPQAPAQQQQTTLSGVHVLTLTHEGLLPGTYQLSITAENSTTKHPLIITPAHTAAPPPPTTDLYQAPLQKARNYLGIPTVITAGSLGLYSLLKARNVYIRKEGK
ncbi:MAG: hypothetical protein HC945_00730, partial [Nitrosarchaeum sp.]|nr:hypothetical protein [Nitrosarchaeum sp.]